MEDSLPDRVLLSSRWLGGNGGVERAVSAFITAFRGSHVDVLAVKHIREGYYVEPERGSVPHRLRWRCPTKHSAPVQRAWRAAQPLVGFRPRPYDLHIHFRSGSPVHEQFAADLRVVIPEGTPVQDIEGHYDAVFAESPANAEFVADLSKLVLMPPPVVGEADSERLDGVPSEFLLTVFNPYGRVKGGHLLLDAASQSAVPIVWCHSTTTRDWDVDPALRAHPNIIHVVDASPSNLRHLYEHCIAYVSLSLSEGFGWAIADALMYGSPIISRRTGVLTIPFVDVSGVDFYDSVDELMHLIGSIKAQRQERSLESLSEVAFLERFTSWYRTFM